MITTFNQLLMAWAQHDAAFRLDGNLQWTSSELNMPRGSVSGEWARLVKIGVFGRKYHDADGYVQHHSGDPEKVALHKECYERIKEAIVTAMRERGHVNFGDRGRGVVLERWLHGRDWESDGTMPSDYRDCVKAVLAAERKRR